MNLAAIAHQLEGAHRDKDGWRARCPIHQGKSDTSLRLWEKDGEIKVECFGGCDFKTVRDYLNLNCEPSKREDPIAIYSYHDEMGNLLYQSVRYQDNKPGGRFRQRQPHPNKPGEYFWRMTGVRKVLYHLPEIIKSIQAEPHTLIYIPEGEKDVETLRSYGLKATCNVGGAKKWTDSYSQSLRGANVIILPDNDQPGRDHADQVEQSLKNLVHSLKRIDLPGLPDKGDVSDWLQTHTIEEFHAIVSQIQRRVGPIEYETFDDFSAEVLRTENVPETRWIVRDILPEGLAALAGRPKQGKSWLALNIAIAVAEGGKALGSYDVMNPGSVLFLALEDNKSRLKWRMNCLMRQVIPWPKNLKFTIFSPRMGAGFAEALRIWLEGNENPSLVVIDMYTKIAPRRTRKSSQNDYDDIYDDLEPIRLLAQEFSVCIMLVMHLNKTADVEDATAQIMGSTAYAGATVTNLILKRLRGGQAADAILSPSGKDLRDDQDIALIFDGGIWIARGDADIYEQSQERLEILHYIYGAAANRPDQTTTTPKDIAEGIGKNAGTTRRLLQGLREDGLITKSYGKDYYSLTNAGAEVLNARQDDENRERNLDTFETETGDPDDGYPEHWSRDVDPNDFL